MYFVLKDKTRAFHIGSGPFGVSISEYINTRDDLYTRTDDIFVFKTEEEAHRKLADLYGTRLVGPLNGPDFIEYNIIPEKI